MADWTKRFTASYRFMRVSRSTGLETQRLRNVKNGGSVTRNSNTAVYESGQIGYEGSLDLGADFLRVYLEAAFVDGAAETVALGTFLPVVEETGVKSRLRSGTAKLYGLLKLLQDDDFDGPYVVREGSFIVEEAKKICESVGLEVVADDSTLQLGYDWVFGVGGGDDSDKSDSKLAAVNKLLDAAGFRSAMTDESGRVLLRRYVEPSNRAPSFEFREGRNARFFHEMTDSTNISEVANVVHVDYSAQGFEVRGTAIDDDPASRFSTANVGRRIVKRYEYQTLPGNVPEDANLLEGADTMSVGEGTRQSKTFRKSESGGSIATVYVPDSPQVGVLFGMKLTATGGRVGFCQDEGPRAEKEKSYTQSLWAKGTAGLTLTLQIFWDQEGSVGTPQKSFELTGEWQKLSATYATTESHGKVSWGYAYLDGTGECTVVADKVEEGSEPTDWPQGAMQKAADAKAGELLRNERSETLGLTWQSVWQPVGVTDAVKISYASGGIERVAVVQSQRVSMNAGCTIQHEGRTFER